MTGSASPAPTEVLNVIKHRFLRMLGALFGCIALLVVVYVSQAVMAHQLEFTQHFHQRGVALAASLRSAHDWTRGVASSAALVGAPRDESRIIARSVRELDRMTEDAGDLERLYANHPEPPWGAATHRLARAVAELRALREEFRGDEPGLTHALMTRDLRIGLVSEQLRRLHEDAEWHLTRRIARYQAAFWTGYGLLTALLLSLATVATLRGLRVIDATLLREAQFVQAKVQSEARYRAITETAHDAIITVDAAGSIVSWNRGAEIIFGYTDAEIIGRPLTVLVPERYRDRHVAAFHRRMPDKASNIIDKPVELHGLRKDHTEFSLDLTLASWETPDGRFVTGIIRDTSDRVRLEQERSLLEVQFQQAQKMESVGRLAGGVAHDFNNMLTVIRGNAALAIQQVDPTHPIHADLMEIQNAADRSADLTRQLLTFARRQIIEPKVLDLNQAIEGTIRLLQRLIAEDVSLVWVPGANVWPVKMDPSQLDQILANLCVNAMDAIAGDGRIVIESNNITIDEDYCAAHVGLVPGEFVRITISDTGHGMDRETLAHIFEPFFTTKVVGKGTGLGLASVYGAVKQNNGVINVYSEPAVGTTFTIYLPRHRDAAVEAPMAVATRRHARGIETVLVVEDEPSILKLTTKVLTRLGYAVLPAKDASEAIHLAREHADAIQLVVTDVIMPGMNGRDLVNELLSRNPTVKVLFMSGYSADVIIREGVLEEGVNLIEKPFTTDDLAAKVRAVLESE